MNTEDKEIEEVVIQLENLIEISNPQNQSTFFEHRTTFIIIWSILFIILIIKMLKSISGKKLYLGIFSFVWLMGTLIGFGTALNQFLNLTLISDEEYLVGSYNSNFYQCEKQRDNKMNEEVEKFKTEEEKEACITKETTKVLNQRAFKAKETYIGWFLRGTLFLLIFILHAPKFFREKKM